MIEFSDISAGSGRPIIMAGPCAVESRDVVFRTAEEVKRVAEKHRFRLIFKSSYKKANRLSGKSFATIGEHEALRMLDEVRTLYELPVITDVHEVGEVRAAAEVADVLQIPAFLCRQTELLIAAAKTGKHINIKKGQFVAPEDMGAIADKAVMAGNDKIMLTERGTFFGYHNLVVDFRSLIVMKGLGFPVIFDSTHSLQLPSSSGGISGGQPEYIIPFARAAVAVGVDGLFVEVHPDPESALCDAQSMLKLDMFEQYLEAVDRILEAEGRGGAANS